jgi:DNA-binding winged helix-turn-helix (wHTH) protein/class 3 adenylate cyclase/tetratricopeptide (TPR) repeat protein
MGYYFADCVLETQCYLLRRAGQSIRLRPKVFQVLTYLLTHRDRVIPKQELSEQVWSAQAVSDATIENCVKAIRRAIGDTGQTQRLIETRYGQGYRFIAAVTTFPHGSVSPTGRAAGEGIARLPTPAHVCYHNLPITLEAVCRPPSPRPLFEDDAHSVGEWKVVTIMCCAFIAPVGQGEPQCLETWTRRQHTLHELAHPEAQRYGGMVRPVGSDALLLVFGAPVAQEDHAQRAVFAALSMQRQCAAWQRVGASSDAATLQLRMGLYTGRAAVGDSRIAHETGPVVLGDTVTRAVALQEQAMAGTLLCSETTARLVQRVVRLKAMPLLAVDGQLTLGRIYRVLGERLRHPPAVPRTARAGMPYVGRERELAMLHAVWAQVTRGQGHVVGVVGECGMGKSRLVAEFRHSLRSEPHTYVQGRCVSYGQAIAYQPVLSLLRHAWGITDGNRPVVTAARVRRRLQKVGMDPDVAAPYFLHLLGSITDSERLAGLSPEEYQASMFAVLAQLSLYSSQRCPLVIEVEDLHWIDATSEAWLAALAERLAGVRILLLVTFRPGYHPPWMGKSYATQVALSRLTPHDSAQVVQALLPTPQMSTTLLHDIVTQADGNPFFLEELSRSIAEQGITQPPLTLPDTVHAVLTARMDRLAPTTKWVLQSAAVIGKEVPLSLLAAITQLPQQTLSRSLAQLQAAELLHETTFVPESVYTFKHMLKQETAYQAVLESTRQQQHLRIAQVLAEQFATVAAQQPAWVAHHYTEAAYAEQAIPYWQQAGQRAVDRAAHAEAIAHFTHALTLLRTLPVTFARARQELTLQCSLGVQLATRGSATSMVKQTYTRALELCQQVGNTQELFPVLYGMSRLYKKRGKLQRARDLGEQLLSLSQQHHDSALLLRSHYVLGDTLLWLGEFSAARVHLEQGIAAYDPRQHDPHDLLYEADPWLGCLGDLPVTLWFLGYPEQALQRSAEALALAHNLSHPYSLARVLVDAAYLHWFCREWTKLQEYAEALQTLASAYGFAELHARARYRYGLALVKQGRVAEGLALFHESMEALQAMQSGDAHALRLAQLAELYRYTGQPERGLHLLAEAMAADTEERFDAPGRYTIKGELLLQLLPPDVQRAEGCFQQALAIARRQQAKLPELRAALCLSRLWQQQGKRAEARLLLAPVYNWFTEGFATADLQEAKVLLTELGG